MMDKERRKFLKWAVAGTITLAGIDVLSKEKNIFLKYFEDFKESFKEASSKPKEGISPASDYQGEGKGNWEEFDGPKKARDTPQQSSAVISEDSSGSDYAKKKNLETLTAKEERPLNKQDRLINEYPTSPEGNSKPSKKIPAKEESKLYGKKVKTGGSKKPKVSGTYDKRAGTEEYNDLNKEAYRDKVLDKKGGEEAGKEAEKRRTSEGEKTKNKKSLEVNTLEGAGKGKEELDVPEVYKIFDKNRNETGMYLDKQLYNGITKEVISGKPVKVFWIPGEFYVESGQGWFSRFGNQIASGGRLVPVYSKNKVLDGIYTSQGRARRVCKNNYDGNLKSLLEDCLDTNCSSIRCTTELKEVQIDSTSLGGGGSDGGAGGAGGGGQGGGGGGSAGAR